jgi:hypothetical protein
MNEIYKSAVLDGCTLEYKDVSLCDLRVSCPWKKNHTNVFQVYARDFANVYSSLDDAIKKFSELKYDRRDK